jgi:spore coat polysaccharide biosynthesis predicted glycosyltransferase SpsG
LDKNYNILICPLEWGLGHAARMIPLAHVLREMNNNVLIGSGEEHLALFRSELPGLSYINFPGFKPGYSRLLPQYLSMLLRTPQLLYHIILEHNRLKKIIREHDIDIVISDNRFGLWNRNVTTAYVTHMPLIPFPKPFRFLEFIGVSLHRAIIKRFSLCLIPDLPGELNVSGRLSHGIKLPGNVRYCGILSRFSIEQSETRLNSTKTLYNIVILSGPEPQRSILKQKLTAILKGYETQTIILEGKPEKTGETGRSGNIIFYSHLPDNEMRELITGSDSIIARSGYSTIMELISLNCSALLIPTPGQTEQEYLAEYLSEKGWFKTLRQKELSVDITLTPNKAVWSGEIVEQSRVLLTESLRELLEKHHKKN